MTARARAGCQACRVRHLKCDQVTPVCGRCRDFDRECTRGYPYRNYKQKFEKNQKWLRTPTELTWEDETEKIIVDHDDSDSDNPQFQSETETPSSFSTSTPQSLQDLSSLSPFQSRTGLRSEKTRNQDGATILNDQTTISGHEQSESLPHIPGVSQLDFAISQLPSPVPSTSKVPGDSELVTLPTYSEGISYAEDDSIFDERLQLESDPKVYLDRSIWPLTDPAEALLLRHYVQNLAIWLDLCDPMQHFQVEVPQRAGTCPILLNAIYALSARHLSIVGKYDTFASNRYHQECLKHLIPMLSNSATVADETLFAATIILRVLEEIDLLETDLQSHMLGITVFVSSSLSAPHLTSPFPCPGLWAAAFWVGLRQEIYVATIKHVPVSLDLSHSLIDRSVSPASDFEWANRAVVHCADVINSCFGHTEAGSSRWWELKEHSEQWKQCKPSSFTPIYWRDPDAGKGEVFPEVWHSHACHIIGVQHHKLAQILLSIFDPRIPKVGGAARVAVRAMEKEIKPLLLELCGIAIGNRWTPPGMFTASMGIAICGDRFTERQEQEALLDVLIRTETDHARPTAAVQKQMREAWGWKDDS